MALDESQAYELHTRLEAVLGARSAVLLMSQLPTMNWADLATKQDLALLAAEMRAEFRDQIVELTHKMFFGVVGIVLTSVSLSFAAARFGG
jgi:hypothetical protein